MPRDANPSAGQSAAELAAVNGAEAADPAGAADAAGGADPAHAAGPADASRAADSAGAGRPRQERAQATQAAIIRAAATIFAERGYARTTLDVVAVEAGVTKGALYFHFASKHALANAVIKAETELARARADEVMATDVGGIHRALLLSRGVTEQMMVDVVVAAGVKLTTEELVSQLDITDSYATWFGLFETCFAHALAEGDLRPGLDPAVLSHFITAAFTGVQLVSNSLEGRSDFFDRVRQMWQIVLPGLVVEERVEATLALADLIRAD